MRSLALLSAVALFGKLGVPSVAHADEPPPTEPALPAATPVVVPLAAATSKPDAVEPYPLPDLAPAVQRLLDEPYLTEVERRALRVRHGQWTSEDLSDANDTDAAAAAALIVGDMDHPSFTSATTRPLLRAQAEMLRGEYTQALARLAPLCEDATKASLLALRLRAQCLDAMGRASEADAALDPLVARMAELAVADAWSDADEIAEGVRGLMLRVRWRGPEKGGGADFKNMLSLLQRARETVDKLNWNVPLAEAELLADKDNYPDAAAALTSALILNPRLAGAWAMLGQLSINGFDIERAEQIAARLDTNVARLRHGGPGDAAIGVVGVSLDASLTVARARMRQKDADAAVTLLDPWVGKLPGSLSAAATRAAAAAARFDFADVDARLGALDTLSPGSPLGYFAVGQALSEARQYEESARYLGEAAKRSQHWAAPVVELGLLEVQSGRNEQALAALERAVTLDPFNVRVANSLKLVSDLRAFATIESPHFIVRYRPGVDEVLAREMPEILERIHARVTGDRPGGVRHEPAAKTVIELMPDHQWFSVRITGMPRIHTIAAATGPLVAMEAPRSGPGHSVGAYDWPRVLQHEYTHTVTLSRTKNRLPHWFTEAAAVYLEDSPRDWSTVQLLARTADNDELFTLDEINIAFVRPKRPSDRQLAYAQGHWMYEYIVERFGPEAPLKLMDAYAGGAKEEQAYQTILGTSREAFLAHFTAWAKAQLVAWGMVLPEATPGVDALLTKHNTQVTSEGGEPADEPTPEMIERWIEQFPAHPDLLQSLVTNRLKAAGDVVNADLVPWLEKYAAARPPDPLPHKLLARYFLDGKGAAAGQGRDAAIPHLRFLDQREQHSPTFAMELARLFASKQDWQNAQAFAARAVAMSPYDAGVREFAATIALQHKDYSTVETHLRALVLLEPDRDVHNQRLAALLKLKNDATTK